MWMKKKEIIKINKINKAFRENPVLIDLDFSVYDNDVIYIKGENGCGKSTLLKVDCLRIIDFLLCLKNLRIPDFQWVHQYSN